MLPLLRSLPPSPTTPATGDLFDLTGPDLEPPELPPAPRAAPLPPVPTLPEGSVVTVAGRIILDLPALLDGGGVTESLRAVGRVDVLYALLAAGIETPAALMAIPESTWRAADGRCFVRGLHTPIRDALERHLAARGVRRTPPAPPERVRDPVAEPGSPRQPWEGAIQYNDREEAEWRAGIRDRHPRRAAP
jgi:hypothetical protein